MNGKDIFFGLKYVGEDLIEGAETAQFPNQENQKNTHRKIRRPLLIAAVIALMLLLAGCAVVYVLSLNGIKLGEQLVTYDVYDEIQTAKTPLLLWGRKPILSKS